MSEAVTLPSPHKGFITWEGVSGTFGHTGTSVAFQILLDKHMYWRDMG